MGIVVRKLTKFQASRPQVIKKRSYKHFNAEAFLVDILTSNINTEVLKEHTVDGAAEKFETMFKKVLDNHAPERNIQEEEEGLYICKTNTSIVSSPALAPRRELGRTP